MAYEKDYDDTKIDIYKGRRADNHCTPFSFFEFLYEEFLFDPTLDVCASHENHIAPNYFTKENSCLTQNWNAHNIWINPPYGRAIIPFLEKCNEQIKNNKECHRIMALLPARTDTKWFHDIVCKGATRIYLLKGRFNFNHESSVKGANAPFASILVEYTKNRYHDQPFIQILDVPKEYRGW